MSENDMRSFNTKIIEEFRANDGKVAMFADYPMVILHTIGAKSGNPLLVPLVLTINDASDWLLFGSFAGSPKNPAWVYNLRAYPEIDIEYGTETLSVNIIELSDAEAKQKVYAQAKISDVFAGYIKSAAPRNIPVFKIERN
jgi:deazaflavin-dependent oxidoreductase (nitroreductase family)